MEEAALAALDLDALARDAADLVRVPSVTGDERAALELLAERADAAGLAADLHQHDLAALRAHPDHPGEEAPRDELWGVTATLAGSAARPAVPERARRRRRPGHRAVAARPVVRRDRGRPPARPRRGRHEGRRWSPRCTRSPRCARAGAPTPEVVLQAVASEEDGGLGTFAALERDAAFDAALLPEPTGLRVVCAQAGALTFRGVVRGRSAHAAERLAGCSAIDRYVRVHAALARPRGRPSTRTSRTR